MKNVIFRTWGEVRKKGRGGNLTTKTTNLSRFLGSTMVLDRPWSHGNQKKMDRKGGNCPLKMVIFSDFFPFGGVQREAICVKSDHIDRIRSRDPKDLEKSCGYPSDSMRPLQSHLEGFWGLFSGT